MLTVPKVRIFYYGFLKKWDISNQSSRPRPVSTKLLCISKQFNGDEHSPGIIHAWIVKTTENVWVAIFIDSKIKFCVIKLHENMCLKNEYNLKK